MKWTLIVVLFLAGTGNANAWDLIEPRTGNHCKDQYENHLYNEFGPEFEIYKVTKVKIPGNGGHTEYWIKSNLCENYLIATTIPKATCGIPHYGRVPIYVNRIWARGDCRDVFGRDQYPNRRSTRTPEWLED